MSEIVVSDSQLRSLFGGDTDRSRAIIAAELLSAALEELLKKYFVGSGRNVKDLLQARYAPISTFSARTELANILGLITDDIASDLRTLRKIRNRFAHDLEISFDEASNKDRVGSLNVLRNVRLQDDGDSNFKPRTGYSVAAYALLSVLGAAIDATDSGRRPPAIRVKQILHDTKRGLRVQIVSQT